MFRPLFIVAILTVTVQSAYAADPRCAVPPYGGTVQSFKAFVQSFGHLVVPTKFLSAVCNAKFGGDRTGMYNLGLTDADIDSKDTEDLAVQMIIAMKNLADKIPDQ